MSVDAANAVLRWYLVEKRRLPWRVAAGACPDPYRVWLSEVMLQQTTVAAVIPYYEAWTARWPTVRALAAADAGEVMAAWAGLGYYARARNLHACARAVAGELNGQFPDDEAGLRALPGIGTYTAAAVAAIAWGRRAVVVDGNVERVVARLHAVAEPLPAARRRLRELADAMTPADGAGAQGAGDFAQAMMDLGATVCTPRAPACGRCPVARWCAALAKGRPEAYPVKAEKPVKPRREWTAYWLERDGAVLLERRPPRGLLGGMRALPLAPPPAVAWREVGVVRHVFTHFALAMRVVRASGDAAVDADVDTAFGGEWWPVARIGEAGLPTLFKKAADVVRAAP